MAAHEMILQIAAKITTTCVKGQSHPSMRLFGGVTFINFDGITTATFPNITLLF
jgi:hypothetical protein